MRVQLLTFNLGGYFDDELEDFTDTLLPMIARLIESSVPELFCVHLQELGGKHKNTALVRPLVDSLEQKLVDMGFWSSGLLANLDTKGEFTALGTLVFIQRGLCKQVRVWNFITSEAVDLRELTPNHSQRNFERHCQHMRIWFGPKPTRKGYLLTRWLLPGLSKPVNFVNVHLLADESNVVATVQPFPSEYSIKRMRALNAILDDVQESDDDIVFLFGDFNFRLDLHHFIPWLAKNRGSERFLGPGAKTRKQPTAHITTKSLKSSMEKFEMQNEYSRLVLLSMGALKTTSTTVRSITPMSSYFNRLRKWVNSRKRKKKRPRQRVRHSRAQVSNAQLKLLSDVFAELGDKLQAKQARVGDVQALLSDMHLEFSTKEVRRMFRKGQLDFASFLGVVAKKLGLGTQQAQPVLLQQEDSFVMQLSGEDDDDDDDDELFKPIPRRPRPPSRRISEVNLTRGANESPNLQRAQKGMQLADNSKSVVLEDKKFQLEERALFGGSRRFRQYVVEFDKELPLFNDCRAEQGGTGLYEMEYDFPPSYPLTAPKPDEVLTPVLYADTRPPAWCDRVLMSRGAYQYVHTAQKMLIEAMRTHRGKGAAKDGPPPPPPPEQEDEEGRGEGAVPKKASANLEASNNDGDEPASNARASSGESGKEFQGGKTEKEDGGDDDEPAKQEGEEGKGEGSNGGEGCEPEPQDNEELPSIEVSAATPSLPGASVGGGGGVGLRSPSQSSAGLFSARSYGLEWEAVPRKSSELGLLGLGSATVISPDTLNFYAALYDNKLYVSDHMAIVMCAELQE